MHCYFGNQKLFTKPKTVSFWRHFFRVRHVYSRQNNHAVSRIPDNLQRSIPKCLSPLNLPPTLRPPPSPVYVVLLSILQLEYIFTFTYKYLKILKGKYMKKEKHSL